MTHKTTFFLLLGVLLALAACTGRPPQKALMLRVQDSMKLGSSAWADSVVRSQMAAATDSDTYFTWLSQRNKGFYATMQVDSFLATAARIHHYLQRRGKPTDDVRRGLWIEWLMARSAYYSAFLGLPDSALAYTDSALTLIAQQHDRLPFLVVALTNRAYFLRMAGRLDESAEGYLKALEAQDSLELNSEATTAILLGISSDYTAMGDYANSHSWWERTRQLLPQMLPADSFIYYNDRGNDYYFQQHYDEALDCFRLAADMTRDKQGKEWDYYTAVANLGETYVCLGRAGEARQMINEADSFFRKVDFPPLVYYIQTSRIELAMLEGHTADALRMARQSDSPSDMLPVAVAMRLKVVEQVMASAGDYRTAYDTHQQLHTLNDSIQSANTRMQASARFLQYEHDKKLLEQQSIIDHQQMGVRLAWALFAAALLAVVLLGVLLLLRRSRQHRRDLTTQQQIVSLRMENTRNRITPHFIYNALNHEMLAQLEGRRVDLGTLTQLLRRGIGQADQLQTTLAEELAFVDYYVSIEGQQMGSTFEYTKEIAPDVDTTKVRLPAMTVQIFAENAIKHGLRPLPPEAGCRRLTIHATRQGEATLVEVIDNGRGLSDQHQQEHTGMRVVRQTMQLLNERNAEPITFGVGNRPEGGCRSWLLLPDRYEYKLV